MLFVPYHGGILTRKCISLPCVGQDGVASMALADAG